MKCHFCEMEAICTLEIAHRYYIPMCTLHEDTVYHDIEMCIFEKIREVFCTPYDEDKHFHPIQQVIDEVMHFIPFASMEQQELHQKRMKEMEESSDDS